MTTGPNQILLKRSDATTSVPTGLSFGEPAINTASGKLFFQEQIDGTETGRMISFHGFTNESFVTNVNGSTGSVNAVTSVGVSGGVICTDVKAVAFSSNTTGLTFETTCHGNTAHVTLNAEALRSFVPEALYNYSTVSGTLTSPNATSNGDFIFNPDNNKVSIFKRTALGTDYRDFLSNVAQNGIGSIRFFSVSSQQQDVNEIFFDQVTYDGDSFDFTAYQTFPDGVTGASGDQVSVSFHPVETRIAAASHFETPDGSTFDTVVTSFNGITGAVEGVGSFNGATGAVVTDTLILPCAGISLNAGGITFPDGTHQNTAFRAGLKYTIQHTDISDGNPTAGGCKFVSNLDIGDGSGPIFDQLALHDTDANGNDISSLLTLLSTNGGFIQLLKEDGSELIAVALLPSESAAFGSDIFTFSDSSGIEVDTTPSEGDIVYVYVVPNTLTAVESIGGSNGFNKGAISVKNGITVENRTNPNIGHLAVDDRAIEFEVDGSGGRVKGITFDDGTHQSTAAGITHTDENFTAADHTKLDGIEASADVTDAVNVRTAGAVMDSELTSIADVKALDQSVVSGANPVFTFISALAGISVGAGGVTFSDGTQTTTALRTDSYTGQIETVSNKSYTIDPKVATARTVTGFYIRCGSGTVTATLKHGSDVIKAASVSTSSGSQTSLTNTSVAADDVLTLLTTSNSSATDLIFNIEYTS